MKTTLSLTLSLVSAAALAGCASNRGNTASVPATVGPATATMSAAPAATSAARLADQQFVAVAAGSGMYEVEASRVALTRASDAQVRAYAQMLVHHHTANNGELMALVSAKGHRVVPGLPAPLQQKVNILSGLSGPAFDREFIRTTGVADHMAAINAFEQNRRTVAHRDLQAYIDRTLPVLRTHLQQAQDLAGRMAG